MTTPDQYTLIYDGSFDGLLSAVFTVYAGKYPPDCVHITADPNDADLFGHTVSVTSNPGHAARVLERLQRQLGRRGIQTLLYGFLINDKDMPDTFLRIVRLALAQPDRPNILSDYGHPDVMQWAQWVKTVGREKHHMEAFVRFEHSTDDIYFARVEPDFNVLPLIGEHFRQRYQDQHWAIYDVVRGYGLYYDKSKSTPSRPADLQTITDLDGAVLRNPASIHSKDEQRYQKFWQGYFTNVNIKERKNPRLHRQYLPQRYCKYLSEKQVLPNAEHLQKRR